MTNSPAPTVAPTVTAAAAAAFARDGALVVPDLLPSAALEALRDAFAEPVGPDPHRRGGLRGLFDWSPPTRALAVRPEVWGLAAGLIGPEAVAVRATLFDKSPDANWAVPWHRDERVELTEPVDSPEWRAWKRLGDRWTAFAPRDFLLKMVAVRVRLDDCGPRGGALRVLAGSHRGEAGDEILCDGPAGGAVALCPPALHASGRADFDEAATPRRRVIHLEYAPPTPPGGARWPHALRA